MGFSVRENISCHPVIHSQHIRIRQFGKLNIFLEYWVWQPHLSLRPFLRERLWFQCPKPWYLLWDWTSLNFGGDLRTFLKLALSTKIRFNLSFCLDNTNFSNYVMNWITLVVTAIIRFMLPNVTYVWQISIWFWVNCFWISIFRNSIFGSFES